MPNCIPPCTSSLARSRPWLPILTNIESPALRCRAATDKLISHAECYCDWPWYDVYHPPPLRLESRKPLWRDLQTIDVTSRWSEDWQSAMVVNSTLVVDPTISLPGFDLDRRQWSLPNRFRTGQGHCNASTRNGVSPTMNCVCVEIQTVSHIVNSFPLIKFDGDLLCLHEAHGCHRLADNIRLLAHDNNNNHLVSN